MGVAMKPGAYAFTVMLWGFSSAAAGSTFYGETTIGKYA